MNLSVPKVPQSRGRAQRNHNTWDLQKRSLNATPYNDTLKNCVISTQIWWDFFPFPTWKCEVHKERIYGVTYTKPRHKHFWEELNPQLCSCVLMEAKSIASMQILYKKTAVRNYQLTNKWAFRFLVVCIILAICCMENWYHTHKKKKVWLSSKKKKKSDCPKTG